MENTWLITVSVRERGAIGVFYPKTFNVVVDTLIAETNRDVLFAAWQKQYSDQWEPNNLLVAMQKDAGVVLKFKE